MSERSSLASTDHSTHPNGHIKRKLYMPSHDLQFDLEMARRTSAAKKNADSTHVGEHSGQSENSDQLADFVERKPMKFGLIDFQCDEIDEQALEQLAIPEPLEYHPGLEKELRPSSIFVYNRSIALLKTEQIISHVLHLLGNRSNTFTHLEWVDDFSCVLAFTTNADAIEAFVSLLIRPDEMQGENGLPEAFTYLLSDQSTVEIYTAAYQFVCTPRPAMPFSKELFQVNPKNKLHQPSQPEQLIPFIRFATNFDVKASSARDKSLFYALNGIRAGQEGVLSKWIDPSISKKTKPSSQEKSLLNDRWAHSELPEPHRSSPARSNRRLPKSSNSKSQRSRLATSRTLDEELDRFMNRTDDTTTATSEASRSGKKRGREEKDDGGDEKKTPTSRQKTTSLPKVLKPSIELLPDRPSTRGGNLKDELFSTVTTNFDCEIQDQKPRLSPSELKQDPPYEIEGHQGINFSDGKMFDENLDSSMIAKTEEQRGNELMDLEEYKGDHQYNYRNSADDGNHDQASIDLPNQHYLENKKEQYEKNPTTAVDNHQPDASTQPNKNRWGPLFSKIL